MFTGGTIGISTHGHVPKDGAESALQLKGLAPNSSSAGAPRLEPLPASREVLDGPEHRLWVSGLAEDVLWAGGGRGGEG